MRIGELGKQADLSTKTIRYYESIGLLPEPARTISGYRDYDRHAPRRLGFIRAAQSVGLSLGEIREVLELRDRGQPTCGHVTALIEQHAEDLDGRIRELQEMREDLSRLAKRARRLAGKAGSKGSYCHIIEGHGSAPSRRAV